MSMTTSRVRRFLAIAAVSRNSPFWSDLVGNIVHLHTRQKPHVRRCAGQ